MLRGRRVDQQLIEKVGWPCLWYENTLSTEVAHDGSTSWGDDSAGSRGYVEEAPAQITVMFTSHNSDEKFEVTGAWESGKARGTVDANIFIADQERIIPQVHSFPYKFQFERGGGAEDVIKTPWLQRILILRDSSGRYTENNDFKLSNNLITGESTITWVDGGRTPSVGTKYSVKALIFPIWRVSSVPKVRGLNRDDQLPWVFDLVRDDVGVRGGV